MRHWSKCVLHSWWLCITSLFPGRCVSCCSSHLRIVAMNIITISCYANFILRIATKYSSFERCKMMWKYCVSFLSFFAVFWGFHSYMWWFLWRKLFFCDSNTCEAVNKNITSKLQACCCHIHGNESTPIPSPSLISISFQCTIHSIWKLFIWAEQMSRNPLAPNVLVSPGKAKVLQWVKVQVRRKYYNE